MDKSESRIPAAGIEYAYTAEHVGQAEFDTGILRVSGTDRVKWLHKLITADVEQLVTGQGVRGALLEAKGHFIADFVVLALDECFLLLVTPDARDLLLRSLRRYILREKARVDDETERWKLLTLIGAESDAVVSGALHVIAPSEPYHWTRAEFDSGEVFLVRGVRAPFPATDLLVPADMAGELARRLGTPRISPELAEVLRVEAGLPRWGVDFDSNTLALEIPDVMSIRVDQGCYIGQEVVARIVHRGHVNRHLVGLRLEGQGIPGHGAPILSGGAPVGTITSAVDSPRLGVIALGYVRREVAAPGTEVRVETQGTARVVELPFVPSV